MVRKGRGGGRGDEGGKRREKVKGKDERREHPWSRNIKIDHQRRGKKGEQERKWE